MSHMYVFYIHTYIVYSMYTLYTLYTSNQDQIMCVFIHVSRTLHTYTLYVLCAYSYSVLLFYCFTIPRPCHRIFATTAASHQSPLTTTAVYHFHSAYVSIYIRMYAEAEAEAEAEYYVLTLHKQMG